MIKTEQEFIEKVSKFPFRFAKTYAKSAPHEYFICDYSDPIVKEVQELMRFVEDNGKPEMFYSKEYIVYYCPDGHKYWNVEKPEETNIINRNWDKLNADGTVDESETKAKLEK